VFFTIPAKSLALSNIKAAVVIDEASKVPFVSEVMKQYHNTPIQGFGSGDFISYPIGSQDKLVWAITYKSSAPATTQPDEWGQPRVLRRN